MPYILKSLRIFLLIVFSFLKRKVKVVVILVVLTLLLTFSQLKFSIFNLRSNSISIGIVGTYQENDLPLDVTRLLSTQMVKADSTGKFHPLLFSGWEVNNDATQYKVKLKENLK